jgi:hypothetical protein
MSLSTLRLAGNKLATLPRAIWNLANLKELITTGNNDFVLPARPDKDLLDETYGVDFEGAKQLSAAAAAANGVSCGPATPIKSRSSNQGPQVRKPHNRHSLGLGEGAAAGGAQGATAAAAAGPAGKNDADSSRILEGMKRVAGQKSQSEEADEAAPSAMDLGENSLVRPQRVLDKVHRRHELDYEEIFPEDVLEWYPGRAPIMAWRIENFAPARLPDENLGQFYESDCYIVLHVDGAENRRCQFTVFVWVGSKATMDKKASAAMHAMNLRNLCSAERLAQREEQGEESEEFLRLFPGPLVYLEGGSKTGFYAAGRRTYNMRLYVLYGSKDPVLLPVHPSAPSLDSRFTYLLDAGRRLYVWAGRQSSGLLKSKGRLMCEMISKVERNASASISIVEEGDESAEFWETLGSRRVQGAVAAAVASENTLRSPLPTPTAGDSDRNADTPNAGLYRPRLYRVGIQSGRLELPQILPDPGEPLAQKLLDPHGVFVLDTGLDVFVWIGRHSMRLYRVAGMKLAQEMASLLERPDYGTLTKVSEMSEVIAFRCHFRDWDDVAGVDHTRPGAVAQRTVRQIQDRKRAMPPPRRAVGTLKADISALFRATPVPLASKEAYAYIDSEIDKLEKLEAFVLEDRNFVRMPKTEFGHFYTEDCYVFLCTYSVPTAANPKKRELQCRVYFWQGRESGNMGWFTFTFAFRKQIEQLVLQNYECNLEVFREWQQRESPPFLALFKGRFIIHRCVFVCLCVCDGL